jgi:DNA polymerase-1
MSKWGLKFDLDSKTRSKGKEWSDEECQVMIDRFHAQFKKLSKWLKDMQNFAIKNGYTFTLFGRRRWLPQLKSKVWKEKASALRMAINTPIQSAGSDIMMLGIVNIRKRLDMTRARLVATVHDSVLIEVRNDYLDEALPIIKDCLENPHFRGERLKFLDIIPLVAEFEMGPKYGTMEEIKF